MTDRKVLVTGAARGIGAAVAAAFEAAGDRVARHHRTPSADPLVVSADLRDPDATRAMVDAAAEALGGLDVVVNNAAVYLEHKILETGYEAWQAAWRDTLAVDLLAPANVCWAAARHLPRGGRIVNVSSRGAYRGEPDHPAYGAAKAGLNSMTQSLARALAPHGIAVTAVAPGFVATDMVQSLLASPAGAAIRAQSPFDRVATAEEIAAAVLHLASPAAEWSSGAILDLNGASYFR